MGNIVGIDLGTTNSVAAFKFANAQVVTVLYLTHKSPKQDGKKDVTVSK